MTSKNDLHKLIINNLAIVETASAVLPEVQETVFSVINTKIKEWVKDQKTGENGSELWDGEFDVCEEDKEGTWFCPKKWINENAHTHAAFSIDYYPSDSDCFHLSLLCNEIKPTTDNYICITFAFPYTDKSNNFNKRSWKSFIEKRYEENEIMFSANSIELNNSEGELFIRLVINPQSLAECYPDNLEDALEPIDTVLEKIRRVYPIIDAIHEEALNK